MEIPNFTLSGPALTGLMGAVFALLLEHFPMVKVWWGEYKYKRETIAGVYFVMAWALVGLHYVGAIDLGLGAFGWPVAWSVLNCWWAAVGAGEIAHTAQRRLIK